MSSTFQIAKKIRVAIILNLRRIFSDSNSISLTVTSVPDGTTLDVTSSVGVITGDTITQGINASVVTSVPDGTTIKVFSTTGFIAAAATGNDRYAYVELISGEYDFDKTRIVISDSIPSEHAFFPAITVDTISGTESRYLGPDSYRTTKDINNVDVTDEIFASFPSMTVNINIHTIDDTKARDEILDRIYDHFKLITTDLAEAGIEIKRTSFVPDRRAFNGDRWYITATISMEVYSEWSDNVGVDQTVSGVNLTLSLEP
jgi:hypothetical protein